MTIRSMLLLPFVAVVKVVSLGRNARIVHLPPEYFVSCYLVSYRETRILCEFCKAMEVEEHESSGPQPSLLNAHRLIETLVPTLNAAPQRLKNSSSSVVLLIACICVFECALSRSHTFQWQPRSVSYAIGTRRGRQDELTSLYT